MGVTAKLYRSEAERDARVSVALGATIRNEVAIPIDVDVVDLSTTGLRAIVSADLAPGEMVSVGLPGLGRLQARVVRRDGNEVGCAFSDPITSSQIDIATSTQTVVEGPFVPLPSPTSTVRAQSEAEPDPDRWPVGARIALIVGSSAALWAAIIAGTRAVIG